MVKLRKQIVSVMCLLLMLQTTSCMKTKEQESGSSVSNSSANLFGEMSVNPNTKASSSEGAIPGSEIETSLSNAGSHCESDMQNNAEQNFNLYFSDDLKVYDYGQKTVDVYRAKFADYIEFSEPFFSEWIKHLGELDYLVNWSTGGTFSYSPVLKNWEDSKNYDGIPLEFLEFQCSDYDTLNHNIQNVKLILLNEIDDGEKLSRECGIDPNSQILCWDYNVVDFPIEDAVKSFYDVPVDSELFAMKTVMYAEVRAQFINGIPVVMGAWDRFFYCTYDWPDVIEPSRRVSPCNHFFPGYFLANPSNTCLFYIDTQRYTTTEVIKADLTVVDPNDCLEGITDTIKYQPSVITDGNSFAEAWGKDIEVYCMELTYIALDPNPQDSNESEDSKQNHVLYLVPAWKAYYICTDPNSNAIGHGTLVVNAATGESLFSSTIPQGTNLELYPDLYKEG